MFCFVFVSSYCAALALYAVWAAGGIHVENLSFVVLMLMGTVSAAVDPVAVSRNTKLKE